MTVKGRKLWGQKKPISLSCPQFLMKSQINMNEDVPNFEKISVLFFDLGEISRFDSFLTIKKTVKKKYLFLDWAAAGSWMCISSETKVLHHVHKTVRCCQSFFSKIMIFSGSAKNYRTNWYQLSEFLVFSENCDFWAWEAKTPIPQKGAPRRFFF